MESRVPLRVVIAGETFAPDINGTAIFSLQLATGLAKRGHEVHIITPSWGEQNKSGTFTEVYNGIELTVHRLRSFCWPFDKTYRAPIPWHVGRDTGPILDATKPDALHIQTHFSVGRGTAREAYKRGVRIVATNNFVPENFNAVMPFWKTIGPRLVKFLWEDATKTFGLASAITAPTELAADYLRAALRTDRHISVISCGIDVSKYVYSPLRPPRNEIVFVGRIMPEKQLDVLLRAVPSLPPILNATLRVIGKGSHLCKLKRLAGELGIGDRVVFAGYVSEDKKRSALAAATVFVMPSVAELQSISSLEAMASGLPVVAAKALALPHLVDGNGYLFEAGNATDLAEKLARVLIADDEVYLSMKRQGRKMAEKHDIGRTIDSFEALYRGKG